MKTIQLAAIAFLGLGFCVQAQDDKDNKASEVATALKGKLIAQEDGKIVEAELTGDPEYYVLYHSASW